MPDGERVTTGSEPRRTFTLKRMGYSPNACFIREGADQLHPGEAVRVVEVVEPGHDEQTEREFHLEELLRMARKTERERTVAAVAEALPQAMADGCTLNVTEVQRWIEERFKPSAPGGDDG